MSDVVEHVHSINVTMINGENGARIKTFAGSADPHSIAGGGSGYVRVRHLITVSFNPALRHGLNSLIFLLFTPDSGRHVPKFPVDQYQLPNIDRPGQLYAHARGRWRTYC